MNLSTIRKFIKVFAINVFVLCILLAIVEGGASLVLSGWNVDKASTIPVYVDPYTNNLVKFELQDTVFLGPTYKPYSLAEMYYLNENWKSPSGLYTDKWGFIHNGEPDRNLEVAPISPAKRIYMFGGSSLAGGNSSSSNQKTIPAFTEQELRKVNNRMDEVVNAGVGGFESWRELLFAIHVSGEKPADGLIFFDGRNDWFRLNTSKIFVWNHNHEKIILSTTATSISGKIKETSSYKVANHIYHTFRPVMAPHPIVRIVDHGTTLPKDGFTVDPEQIFNEADPNGFRRVLDFRKQSVDNIVANWRAMAGLCLGLKKPCIIALQPTMGYGKRPLTEYNRKYLNALPFKGWSDSQNKFFDAVRERLPGLEKEFFGTNVRFLDLTEIFTEEDGSIYIDSIHYNDYANCILGRTLATQMNGLKKSPIDIRKDCAVEVK